MDTCACKTGARKMRVVGVDPAAAGPTGYAVVETDGRAAWTLRFGALRHPARATFPARLKEIHRLISELLVEFSPDAVAVENIFAAPNLHTSLKLAEVRGVVLLAAAQASLPVHSYSPREVKAGVAGYGAATKQQMQRMVASLLRLRQPPASADAADALAVALCHIFAEQAGARFVAATVRAERSRPAAGSASPLGRRAHSPSRAPRIETVR